MFPSARFMYNSLGFDPGQKKINDGEDIKKYRYVHREN